MKTTALPDQILLNECFVYDKHTGNIFWNIRPLHHFKDIKTQESFNKNVAGSLVKSVKNGYYIVSLYGKSYMVSRIIWKMLYGEDPIHIDHIDNDSLNNKLDNLRNVTLSNNNTNRRKSKSKRDNLPKGVTFRKNNNKYRAQIAIDGKTIELGLFDTAKEGYIEYCKAAKYYHKEFANYDPDYPINIDEIPEYIPKETSYITNIMDFKYASECFDYDPETGIMEYKARPLEHFNGDSVRMKHINAKAGKIVNAPASSGLRAKIDGSNYYVHRLAVLLMTGENPEYLVEHVDGDNTNNAWDNLKIIPKPEKVKKEKIQLTDLSNEYLTECIDVDPTTGIVKFKQRPLHHFKSESIMKNVNTQCAGKEINMLNSHGYIRFTLDGSTYLLHRVMHKLKVGYDDPTMQIDHIDGNKTNNAFDNLRFATNQENSRNVGVYRHNTSGAKGVSKLKNGKFTAQITVDRKSIYLGTFSTLSNASDAYNDAALRYFGEFARK